MSRGDFGYGAVREYRDDPEGAREYRDNPRGGTLSGYQGTGTSSTWPAEASSDLIKLATNVQTALLRTHDLLINLNKS